MMNNGQMLPNGMPAQMMQQLKDGIDFLNWTRCAVFQDALIEKMKDVCERVCSLLASLLR